MFKEQQPGRFRWGWQRPSSDSRLGNTWVVEEAERESDSNCTQAFRRGSIPMASEEVGCKDPSNGKSLRALEVIHALKILLFHSTSTLMVLPGTPVP